MVSPGSLFLLVLVSSLLCLSFYRHLFPLLDGSRFSSLFPSLFPFSAHCWSESYPIRRFPTRRFSPILHVVHSFPHFSPRYLSSPVTGLGAGPGPGSGLPLPSLSLPSALAQLRHSFSPLSRLSPVRVFSLSPLPLSLAFVPRSYPCSPLLLVSFVSLVFFLHLPVVRHLLFSDLARVLLHSP